MTRGSFFVSVGLACGLLAAACGSRGPLDDEAATVDAGVDAAPEPEEPTPEAGPVDASKPVDAGREAGTIIDCGICLVGQCTPAIFTCVSDPSCVSTFQCVVSTCFGSGGGLDPLCLFKCASGASKGALEILQIFQCVTGKCGPDCGQLLQLLTGGLGGGGGGGGFGGGGGKKDAGTAFDAGAKMMSAPTPQQSFAEAFSAWPELSRPLVLAPRD